MLTEKGVLGPGHLGRWLAIASVRPPTRTNDNINMEMRIFLGGRDISVRTFHIWDRVPHDELPDYETHDE